MDCQEYIEHFLGADADRELSADEAAAVSRHLAGCTNCATRLASERAFKAFLRRRVPIVATPANVRRQIVAELDRPAWSRLGDRLRPFMPALRWAPLAVAALLLVIAIVARRSQTPTIPAFDEAVASFATLRSEFVPNVSGSSVPSLEQRYKGWIGVPVSVWNLDKLGYRLVGGRLDRLGDGRPVAYTLYTGPDGQILCAFQRFADFSVPPGGQTVNRVHHFYRYKNVSLCLTIEGDMVCILTCRMPLADFIRALKQVES